MLQKQVIPIPLAGGINTKTDDKSLALPALTIAENVRRQKAGKLEKRHGCRALGDRVLGADTQLRGTDALGTFDNELLLFNKDKVYSYSECPARSVDKGDWISVITDAQDINRNDYDQKQVDTASACGLSVFAWEDSRGGVRCSVYDNDTGALVISDTELHATATHPRCIAFNDFMYVLMVNGGDLIGRRISTTNPTIEAPTTVSSTLHTTNVAYSVITQDAFIVLAYNVAGSSEINVNKLNDSLTIQSTNTLSHAGAVIELARGADAETYIAFYDGSAVRSARLDVNITELAGPTAIETIANIKRLAIYAPSNGSGAVIFYEQSAAQKYNHLIKKCSYSSAGTAGTPAVWLRSVGIASRAWIYERDGSERAFLVVVHESTLQSTFFVARHDGLICGKFKYGASGGILEKNYASGVNTLSNGSFQVATLTKNQLIALGDSTLLSFRGITAMNLKFTDYRAFSVRELGGNGLIAGGVIGSYDSQSVVEHGFHLFPENVSLAQSTGGDLTLLGTYSYQVVWYWTDNHGRLHRSAPSLPVQIVLTGSNNRVTLTIPTLRLTQKTGNRTNVVIAVFRTETLGTNYYRASHPVNLTYNNPAVDTVTIVDDLADSTLISREVLYTQGNIIENVAPPTSKVIAVHKKRAFVVDEEDRIWYSKEVTAGRPVEFSDQFIIEVDPTGGKITALASLGDKLVIFKEDSICHIFGDGPDDRGVGGIFSYPQFVGEHIGCIAAESVIRTPDGIMFASRSGIYVLTNDLEISYIGSPVERWNSETITSAVLVGDESEVRFTTEKGPCLVYNYFFREWYTWLGYDSPGAVEWRGDYVCIRNLAGEENIVAIEDKTLYRDMGSTYSMKIGLAWASFAGIQGLQRIWRILALGEYRSPHKLKIALQYDTTNINHDEIIWDPATVTAQAYGDAPVYGDGLYGGADLPYQARIHVRRQKCQALRLILQDLDQEGSGESFSLSGITFEVGVKKGAGKISAGQSV